LKDLAKQVSGSLVRENRIYGKWFALSAFLDRFAAAHVQDYFRRLKYLVGSKINIVCGNDMALSAYDVEIFETYGNIMRAYKMVAEHHLAGEKVLELPEIKGIWDGIYELIMSRILMDKTETDGINPIQAEKKDIVAKAVLLASGRMDELLESYKMSAEWSEVRKNARKQLFEPDFTQLKAVLDEIASSIADFCCESLYNIYLQTSEAALANLNNLETRREAAGYNNLLKEEIEILRQIIVVQAMAIEKAIWKNETSPKETEFLGEALAILRETYQREGQTYGAINRAFLESAARNRENLGRVVMDVESPEDFRAELEEVAPYADLPVSYEKLKNGLNEKYAPLHEMLDEIFQELRDSFDTNLASKSIYFCKKAIWQASHMAEDCCLSFQEIVNHFSEGREYFGYVEPAGIKSGKAESDIIKGISETISIKIETLREAAQQFFAEADSMIEDFALEAKAGIDGFDDFGAKGREFMFERLFAIDSGEKRGAAIVKVIIDNFVDSDFFEDYRQAVERVWAKRDDALAKKILAFKRDSLFFELSTFEEIMNYSVSRLRESADVQILEFVVEVDKQYKRLEAILAKRGIDKIVPKPHEPFNPKEHEVLMAEQNEGFKKGEIIKTMNSGYRQGDMVVVRANVIAAR
jgi:hypothetical protein